MVFVAPEKKHVITSSIEHPAVLKVLDELRVFGLTYDVLSVDSTGLIDPTNLKSAIKKGYWSYFNNVCE